MLSVEQIIGMANQMNIDVSEELEGKHYILDGEGKKVPFYVSMLMEEQSQMVYRESFKVNFYKSNSLTNSEEKYVISDNSSSVCFSNPMDVEQINILAA